MSELEPAGPRYVPEHLVQPGEDGAGKSPDSGPMLHPHSDPLVYPHSKVS